MPAVSRIKRYAAGILFLATLILMLNWLWERPIFPHGGIPFFWEKLIPVPQFFQADPRWRDDRLGGTNGALGSEGCAVTSAAMVLGSYGIDVDPGRLNRFLTAHQGYEEAGWIRWESVAEISPGIIEKAYENFPSYARIDLNLLLGNPVIVRVRRADGMNHFVVIVGKRGFDYLIRDPSRAEGGGKVYPLADLGVPIEALRYYRKLK